MRKPERHLRTMISPEGGFGSKRVWKRKWREGSEKRLVADGDFIRYGHGGLVIRTRRRGTGLHGPGIFMTLQR